MYKEAKWQDEQVNKDDDIITDIHGYGARGGVSVSNEIGLVSGNTNHERHWEGIDRPYHIV